MSRGRPQLKIGAWGTTKVDRQVRLDGRWVTSDAKGDIRYRARARVRDSDGVSRQVEAYAESAFGAEQALQEKLKGRGERGHSASIGADTKVTEVAESWLASIGHQGLSLRTIQDYRYAVARYVMPRFANVRVSEMTPDVIEAIFLSVHKDHGPGAVKILRAVLSQILQKAVRSRVLVANPVRESASPKAKRKAEPTALTEAQERRLLQVMEEDPVWVQRYDLRDLVLFALGTGCRLGEVLGVRWQDLDLDSGTVAITGTAQRIGGMGIIRQDVAKTRSSTRVLRLPSWLTTALRARHSAAELRTEGALEPGAPVFPSSIGTWRDPSNVQRDLRKLFQTAGLQGMSSHVFRRTVATKLDVKGLSAREIADQLGHTNVAMTLNVYMGRQARSSRAADLL